MAPFAVAIAAALAATCWAPPVDAPVTDSFRPPPCTWCAGNRGLEYATVPGTPVRAVERGVVSWAGQVAGVRYVVVTHADGLRATYGRLSTVAVRTGTTIVAGARVGSSGRGFYFGLRDGEVPVDPTPRLGRLTRRPRLVPLDGSAALPSPVRLVCRNPRVGR